MGFSRQEDWSELSFPLLGESSTTWGSNPRLLCLLDCKADSLPPGKPKLPHSWWLKRTHIYYVTVLGGLKSQTDFTGLPFKAAAGSFPLQTLEDHVFSSQVLRGASLLAQMGRNPPAMQGTRFQFLDRKDPLEKEQATHSCILYSWFSPVAQTVKNLPAMQETWVQSLGQEDPLKEGMATHSSILAWRIPWTEEPGRATVHWGCKESDRTERLSAALLL